MFPNKKFVCSVCHIRVQSKESLEKKKEKSQDNVIQAEER